MKTCEPAGPTSKLYGGEAGSGGPPARGAERLGRWPVAVLVSRFPAVTETFILRELVEMDRLGVELVLVPLLRHRERVVHPQAEPWVRRALYTPFLNRQILIENLRVLLRAPGVYLSTLLTMLWGTGRSARPRSLRDAPGSGCLYHAPGSRRSGFRTPLQRDRPCARHLHPPGRACP
jgi:hypothetical protein